MTMLFHTTSPAFKLRSLSGFQDHLYFKRLSKENALALEAVATWNTKYTSTDDKGLQKLHHCLYL